MMGSAQMLLIILTIVSICWSCYQLGKPTRPQSFCGHYVNRSCSHFDGPYCSVEHCTTLRDIVERIGDDE